ncbi:exodeoxyribonuclease V subunit gamma [Nocardioides mangrovicus]|uniref:RecBCD enzyme subunit RecC n=1 Tax=Nocardioides mangrovicus TaxID=2478913 RepID=A0A3L8NYN0_9ACTN|nr:exodeoxyribonuclease V subunit gamma [Nocardioides mangrovicus]RLV47994.1 exodeoxyribonuclease V subunit gamma [Nocardioides mangrovicus]
MPLLIHRAPRSDVLAEGLADLLRAPLPDPFAQELVIVPAKGVERWLSQRLSHRLGTGPADHGGGDDGVCAGVEFRSPRSLVAEVTGRERDDPWSPDRLVWPLLEVVDAAREEHWCAPLARHLGLVGVDADDELRRGRRYATARRLARLLNGYAVQRPALLEAWEAGRAEDGTGAPLADDLAWQAELWRRLLAHTGLVSPVVRHGEVLRALREAPSELPERVSLFGHTRIPVTEAELLAALGRHHAVHLWLPHASAVAWEALAGRTGVEVRRDDISYEAIGHPLLASLGRDVRELERTLLTVRPDADTAVEAASLEPQRPATLLGLLQADVAADRPRPEGRTLAPEDRSVQVHACHGPARQVEVLREVVLGLLADDPTLEPRDIVVMCPDIEAYAPLVEAAFGLGEAVAGAHPGQRLQVRLADRALTQTNPLLGVVGAVLDLADGRAPASLVLDLMATEPVRRRFGLTDNDLETVHRWVEQAGVRWAFDAEHRDEFGLAEYVQNTWRFGLDRVLAGVAVSDEAQVDGPGYVGTVLPLDDVSSTSIDLAGRLAELVDRLAQVTDALIGVHPMAHWLGVLREGIGSLSAVGRGEEWQQAQLHAELADLADAAAEGHSPDLRLSDVRALMAERLAGRPTRANFRTGTLTVCTMVPMRSVPHRVVCLLGLDDGVFPRTTVHDGDDVLARRPLTGERDPRSEDRQQLLDAVMAATETLVVTYSGFDETTSAERPPAVPLGELLDALDGTVEGATARVVHAHRIQPFHHGYFSGRPPFSFDTHAARGAAAAAAPPRTPPRLADVVLPALPPADVELADLVGFFRDPVGTFLRRRLDVGLLREHAEVSDRIPVELDNLQAWGVGDRLLRQLLDQGSPQQALQREWRRGELPPGSLGWHRLRSIAELTTPIAEAAEAVRAGLAETSRDLHVGLADGRRLVGTATGIHGRRVVVAGYSTLDAKQELDAWITLVALEAASPGAGWTATALGRAKRQPFGSVTFAPPDDARATLTRLLGLYDAGLRGPLPLPLKTSRAWAVRRRERGADWQCEWAARDKWSSFRFSGEDEKDAHVRVWGPRTPLADLLADPPGPGEEYAGEKSRLGALAMALWDEALSKASRS